MMDLWKLLDDLRKARELARQGNYLAAFKIAVRVLADLSELLPDGGEFQTLSAEQSQALSEIAEECETLKGEITFATDGAANASALNPIWGPIFLEIVKVIIEIIRNRKDADENQRPA